jgi:hypothetical protein
MLTVLRSDKFKYLRGLTSYWPPAWSATLGYPGDARAMNAFVAALNKVNGIALRLTFSNTTSRRRQAALCPQGHTGTRQAKSITLPPPLVMI